MNTFLSKQQTHILNKPKLTLQIPAVNFNISSTASQASPISASENLQNKMDNVNLSVSSGNLFICQRLKCKKEFNSREAVFNHMKEHDEAKVYICPEPGCGRKYSRLGRLKIHLKTPYRCSYEGCQKAFTERGNLQVH